MKNHVIALALVLVAGLTAPVHATKGEGTLVQSALTNLLPQLAEAETAGYSLDDGTSVVGLYVAPGKSYDLGRTWRRPEDKFRLAVGKSAGDAEVTAEATIGETVTGVGATMDSTSGDLVKSWLSDEQATGNARWKITFKNTGKKPIYFVVGLLRAKTPVRYGSAAIQKAFQPLFAELESSPRSLPKGTHSLIFTISAPNKVWDWAANFKSGMEFVVNNDKGSADLTVAVLAKDKSVVVTPRAGNPTGISLDADVPGGSVQILNKGTAPVLTAFLYR